MTHKDWERDWQEGADEINRIKAKATSIRERIDALEKRLHMKEKQI